MISNWNKTFGLHGFKKLIQPLISYSVVAVYDLCLCGAVWGLCRLLFVEELPRWGDFCLWFEDLGCSDLFRSCCDRACPDRSCDRSCCDGSCCDRLFCNRSCCDCWCCDRSCWDRSCCDRSCWDRSCCDRSLDCDRSGFERSFLDCAREVLCCIVVCSFSFAFFSGFLCWCRPFCFDIIGDLWDGCDLEFDPWSDDFRSGDDPRSGDKLASFSDSCCDARPSSSEGKCTCACFFLVFVCPFSFPLRPPSNPSAVLSLNMLCNPLLEVWPW